MEKHIIEMKLSVLIFLSSFSLLTFSETTDWSEIVDRDGLFYKKFTDVPFTGVLTGLASGKLKDGVPTGTFLEYHSNGQLKLRYEETISEKNKRPIVITRTYFDDGTLKSKADYLDGDWITGTPINEWLYLDEEKRVLESAIFSEDTYNATYTDYHDNGEIEIFRQDKGAIGFFFNPEDDPNLESSRKFYNKDGVMERQSKGVGDLIEITTYLDGNRDKVFNSKMVDEKLIRHGIQKSYYPNGEVQLESYFKDDLMHGTFKTFNEKGELERSTTYENGIANGYTEKNDYESEIYQTGNFKDGKMHGLTKFKFPKHYTSLEMNFDMGKVKSFVCEIESNYEAFADKIFKVDIEDGKLNFRKDGDQRFLYEKSYCEEVFENLIEPKI